MCWRFGQDGLSPVCSYGIPCRSVITNIDLYVRTIDPVDPLLCSYGRHGRYVVFFIP